MAFPGKRSAKVTAKRRPFLEVLYVPSESWVGGFRDCPRPRHRHGPAGVGPSSPDKANNSRIDATKLKRLTWKVGDVTREALVYAPAPSGKQRPLIFGFHGHGGRGICGPPIRFSTVLAGSGLRLSPRVADRGPILDPDGKMPGWQKYVGDQKDRDLHFFDAMLKTLTAAYQIDEKRSYVSGHSNGGYFTYVLAVARGDKLAAIAPVSAALTWRNFKKWKPLPILHVAGENDQIVLFAVQKRTIEQVRKINGCDPDGKPAGKWCTEYSSRNGPPVVTYIHPGGHEIPAGAAERIVQFFKENGQRR